MINQETDLASRPKSFDHYLKHIDKSGYVNQATFTSKLTYFLEIMKTCQNPMPRLKVWWLWLDRWLSFKLWSKSHCKTKNPTCLISLYFPFLDKIMVLLTISWQTIWCSNQKLRIHKIQSRKCLNKKANWVNEEFS